MAKDYSKFSHEELIKYIEELQAQLKSDKYGLYWDKTIEQEKEILELYTNIPFFIRNKIMTISTCSNVSNLLIEGDNYPVLSVLNMVNNMNGFVDVIYIDPPYNTGHKSTDGGFKYNDEFINDDHGFKHSTWLSFMEKRLKLAKNLLKENGVIVISIDDKELYNLKLLCDSIFGEKNFLGNIVQNKCNAQNDAINIQKNADYHLVYCKKRKYIKVNNQSKESPLLVTKIYKQEKVYSDINGYYYLGSGITTGGEGGTLVARPNLGYTIYYNPNTNDVMALMDYDRTKIGKTDDENEMYSHNPDLIKDGYIPIIPPRKKGKLGVWTWDINKFNKDKGELLIKKTNSGFSITKKIYISTNDENLDVENMTYTKVNFSPLKSILEFPSSQGSKTLSTVLGKQDFNNPKNVDMIKYFIQSFVNQKDIIVLDFFAGSGTTGQAVLELNKEDGGNRRFILCTNNENNICTDVTYPRLKTVITGIRPDGTKYSDGIPANLIYYKTDFIKDSNNTDQAKYCLVEKVDELLCISENIFIQLERNDYSSHYVSNDKERHLFIYSDYYNVVKFNEFKQRVLSATGTKIVYIFSSDNNIDETLFEGIKDVEVKPIPSKIYEIYKEIVEDIKRG